MNERMEGAVEIAGELFSSPALSGDVDKVLAITENLQALKSALDDLGRSRELSIAGTKLDETRLWVQEHFTQTLGKVMRGESA